MTVILKNHKNGKEREFDDKAEAEETRSELIGIGAKPENLEIIENGSENTSDSKARENGQNQSDGESSATQPTVVEAPEDAPDEPPERNLSDDPVEWFGDVGEFTYEKNGTTAINKKGLRVLQYWYDIEITESEVIVGPEETDQTFARVRATAEMPDGRTAVANGSAHVDRGDDPWLLVEMADTRAKSRVLLDITGMGAVAISELENEL